MKKILEKFYISSFVFLTPVVVLAQTGSSGAADPCPGQITNLTTLFNLLGCIIRKSVIPLLVMLAVVVFIIGVVKFISGASDSTKRTEGRNFMIYGIIALFVMVSIWGLVSILQGTFGLGNSVLIPQLQGL
jgi:phosphatidylglycerophosphatase A